MLSPEQQKFSRQYLSYKFVTSLWFMSAVWLYFYRLYINDQQVGILDGAAFAIGLVAEVPSGALADKFGRDRIVKIGQIFAGSGLLIQAVGSSFTIFFIGQAVMMIGVSLASGADEALFFEKLNFSRRSILWRKLVTRASQIALAGSVFSVVIGGWLHTINPRIPWFLTGLAFLSSILIIHSVADDRQLKRKKDFIAELQDYSKNIKLGFEVLRSPKLIPYVPIIIVVQGLFYTAGWGLLMLVLLDRFQFSPLAGSFVVASCSIITVVLLAGINKYTNKIGEKAMLITTSIIAALALILSIFNLGHYGFFIILILFAGERTLYPFMSEALNNRVPSGQRATVLSIASFLRALPYVALAPVIGFLNASNNLEYFFIFWAMAIGVAVLFYRHLKRKS